MASFTDEISKFNPYVQQLPVEAMTQVGMYKQQQYDQGVQKIQSYVDNIAGIDVYKPEQKQYLQSKLNELGGRLRTVAAGDFSNAQLVNSVGGMATQVIKDPIIQSAIYSTQVVRKGDADREVAAKAGKTSPNNDLDWEDQKAQWLNDGKLDSRFNGKYIEHWDVDKKLMERAEKILKNPDVNVQEQRFKHDEKGNTLYYGVEQVKDASGKVVKDKKGKPVTRQTVSLDPSKGDPIEDEAITRISIKGVSPEKLYNNFLDSLDSRDAQQLRIDAWAKYRGATMESFAPNIIKTYDDRKKLQSQEIVNLSVTLAQQNLTSEQQGVLRARLADLQQNEKTGALDKELNATLDALKDPANLERYKEHIYTQQRLIDMAKDMSYKSYQQEIKNNPYMQMYMEKQRYNFDIQKFADESRSRWANYDLAVKKEAFDEQSWLKDFAFKTEKEKREWLEKHPEPVITTTVLPTGVVPKTVDAQWRVAGDAANQMKALENQFADRLFPGMTPEQKKQGFADLIKKYDTNPNANYSPDEAKFLEQRRRSYTDMMVASQLGTAAEALEKKTLAEVYKDVQGAGQYSGQDMVQVAKMFKQFKPKQITEAYQYFQSYEGGKYFPLYKAYYGDVSVPQQKEIKKAIENAQKIVDTRSTNVDKTVADFLAKNSPKKLAQDQALDIETDKTQKSVVNKYLTTLAATQGAIGAGDATKVLGWMSGEGGDKTKVILRKTDDGTTQSVFIKADGSEQVILPMNTDQQGFFPQIKLSSPYGYLKNYIEISPNRTTDLLGKRSPQVDPAAAVNAQLTGYDIPGLRKESVAPLVRFTVEGDYDNNGSANDKYVLNMFIKDSNSPTWKAQRITPNYVPWGGIENILNSVGTSAYYEGLKTWK